MAAAGSGLCNHSPEGEVYSWMEDPGAVEEVQSQLGSADLPEVNIWSGARS